MAYKHRNQRMKCKRVQDPILKQITRGKKEIYMLYDLSLLSQLHAY